MRVLRLDGSEAAKRAFAHFYSALRSKAVEGIDQIRRVGKIMDKLEGIGEKVEATVPDESGRLVKTTAWQLSADGGEVWLDSQEYEELRARMGTTQWLPDHARFVAASFELLEGAAEEEPGKPKMLAEGAA